MNVDRFVEHLKRFGEADLLCEFRFVASIIGHRLEAFGEQRQNNTTQSEFRVFRVESQVFDRTVAVRFVGVLKDLVDDVQTRVAGLGEDLFEHVAPL